tara:strand:+ start:1050 stop:1268 length:219 start_codon:yes stop_codon:yes gene_type:complete
METRTRRQVIVAKAASKRFGQPIVPEQVFYSHRGGGGWFVNSGVTEDSMVNVYLGKSSTKIIKDNAQPRWGI